MNGMGLGEVKTEKDVSVFQLKHCRHLPRSEILEKGRLEDWVGEINSYVWVILG